ncbi:MAG: hypothetical protein IIB67_09170, partial [Proteobacteria bacterium]|nr:hypothetical protein [Pseudomonadota bacterium]
MLETKVGGPMSWEAGTLLPNDGKIELSAECLTELLALARDLEANPLPAEALKLEDFALPRCRELMATVRLALDSGLGFAIIDRLPRDEIEPMTAIKLPTRPRLSGKAKIKPRLRRYRSQARNSPIPNPWKRPSNKRWRRGRRMR